MPMHRPLLRCRALIPTPCYNRPYRNITVRNSWTTRWPSARSVRCRRHSSKSVATARTIVSVSSPTVRLMPTALSARWMPPVSMSMCPPPSPMETSLVSGQRLASVRKNSMPVARWPWRRLPPTSGSLRETARSGNRQGLRTAISTVRELTLWRWACPIEEIGSRLYLFPEHRMQLRM